MTWVRADALKVGQKTAGGQEVLAIRYTGNQYEITWLPTASKRKVTIGYFADQQFDIAPEGAVPQEESRMAQKVNIVVTSDLSDAADASTVEFGLDGTTYEIDLTDKEAEKFRDLLAKYVGAARKVSGSRRGGGRRPSGGAASGPAAKDVREWAQANGHSVPERGRIPAEIREAYDAAH